jgi:hypothetical protein
MEIMQHNNHKLGTRIDEWESFQPGLPEGSETIWAKLEQVLESKTSTKRERPLVNWMAAASLLLLLGTGVYWYRSNYPVQKSVTIQIPAESQPSISTVQVKGRKQSSTIYQQKSRKKQLIQTVNNKSVLDILQPSKSHEPTVTIPDVAVVAELPKPDEKIESRQFNMPLPQVIRTSDQHLNQNAAVNYWRKNLVIRKSTNGMPVLHANDEKRSSTMAVELMQEEKPLPNFEAPLPNDHKSKWRISLQPTHYPNTTGIKE